MLNRTTPFDPKLKKRQQNTNNGDEQQKPNSDADEKQNEQPHPRPQFSASSSSSSDSSEHEIENKKEQEEIMQLPLHEVKIPDWSPPRPPRSRILSYHNNPQRYRRIEPIVEDPDDDRPDFQQIHLPTFQPDYQSNYQQTYQPDFQQIYPEERYFAEQQSNQQWQYDMPTSITVKNRRNGNHWEHFQQTSFNQPEIHRKQQNDRLNYNLRYQANENDLVDKQNERENRCQLARIERNDRQNNRNAQIRMAEIDRDDKQRARAHELQIAKVNTFDKRVNATLAIQDQMHQHSLERMNAMQNMVNVRNPISNGVHARQIVRAANDAQLELGTNTLLFSMSQPFLEAGYRAAGYDKSYLFTGVKDFDYTKNKFTVNFESNQHKPITLTSTGYVSVLKSDLLPHVLLVRMHHFHNIDNDRCPLCPCCSRCLIE